MPDGTLLHLRDTYPLETAWAPRWVGDELRQVRAAAFEARLTAIRASAEAAAAETGGQHDIAIVMLPSAGKTGQAVASSVPALTTGTALMASYSFGETARPCNMAHVMAHNA